MTAPKTTVSAARLRDYAGLFSALADETRLSIVASLAGGKPQSITDLTSKSELTRQAVTKHLKVLAAAGLVHSEKTGRSNLFYLDLRPFKDMNEYLNFVAVTWDQSLGRLKDFLEGGL